MVKKKISMKLQDMKAQGASEEELKRFASEAKAKLATLQNAARTPDVKVVKKKQEEKDSPIVLQKLQVAKGAK